ncbi:hypothetical protein QBC34DRAFT_391893 [Podospora aff. communis PSN243]|uniref:Calcium permeable stress-gated cation channel 1 n=1 Tax=Podospora aff. communis PSN243 TaxID=3040156 RepID=A0AAV9H190_9PEZI|nr:hypothetical protein QBC34DRAFT_391893 [Podospora aff. communis PSN243]
MIDFGMFRGDSDEPPKCHDDNDYTKPGKTDTTVQLVISLALGVTAFLSFCMLRPRWKSLYAARKRHLDPSIALPALPDTFLGWMPALYRVTEQQVLVSAGLDAFVFLSFFKMAMKLFAIIFIFSAFVLEPINRRFEPDHKSDTASSLSFASFQPFGDGDSPEKPPDRSFNKNMGYLWSYLVFTYFFTALTLIIMEKETVKIIRVRQDYLGTQSTITDRTFRLSGIPKELRTEAAIKDLVERLEIGKVESVTLCRNWKDLDDLMDERQAILAKLEETWSVYLSRKPLRAATGRSGPSARSASGGNGGLRERLDEEAVESDGLLRGSSEAPFEERERPQTRFWYGFLRLQSRKTDAIDYYSEKLRLLDEKILAARKKQYEAADIAFVTMDSIAACQMAVQALIDPRPGQLLSKPAPAPSDVVWRNTYAPRLGRRLRSWSITVFVGLLSIVWLAPVAFLASTLSICTIDAAFPSLGQSLREHEIIRSLVQTGLPTAVVSLLNIAVPYLYDFLSYHQGMLSQSDVALSVISKNFFFTFFNIFLIFTVFGAVTSILDVLREGLKDTSYIALTLAGKLTDLRVFYGNFIMLQGLGLFPFRLLEFGSVSLYPVYRLGAKTPRDFAQMFQPPMFYFGFYLPTALLIFILCLVYSALPGGFLVIGLGVVYFCLGYYTYKYQLLYAMDQPQHATGGAWRIICYRIMLGLVVFQVTMSGYLALRFAYTVALLVVPLLIVTVWYSFFFQKQFEPLTRFISLRSIKLGEEPSANLIVDDDLGEGSGREERELLRRGSTIDEDREKGLRFVNPSLVIPLEQPWIYKDPPPPLVESETGDGPEFDVRGSEREYVNEYPQEASGSGANRDAGAATVSSNSSSSVSLGDTHIWRS